MVAVGNWDQDRIQYSTWPNSRAPFLGPTNEILHLQNCKLRYTQSCLWGLSLYSCPHIFKTPVSKCKYALLTNFAMYIKCNVKFCEQLCNIRNYYECQRNYLPVIGGDHCYKILYTEKRVLLLLSWNLMDSYCALDDIISSHQFLVWWLIAG